MNTREHRDLLIKTYILGFEPIRRIFECQTPNGLIALDLLATEKGLRINHSFDIVSNLSKVAGICEIGIQLDSGTRRSNHLKLHRALDAVHYKVKYNQFEKTEALEAL